MLYLERDLHMYYTTIECLPQFWTRRDKTWLSICYCCQFYNLTAVLELFDYSYIVGGVVVGIAIAVYRTPTCFLDI